MFDPVYSWPDETCLQMVDRVSFNLVCIHTTDNQYYWPFHPVSDGHKSVQLTPTLCAQSRHVFRDFCKMILKCLASLIFQMVHFQRVFSFVFRFSLTGAFVWFSIKASFISFFYYAENVSKWCRNWPKAPFVFFPKQDVLSYCQRPTDTKVKYFKLNKHNNWWMSKVAYVTTETDDLPLFTVCPNPSLKWSFKHSIHHVIVFILRLYFLLLLSCFCWLIYTAYTCYSLGSGQPNC